MRLAIKSLFMKKLLLLFMLTTSLFAWGNEGDTIEYDGITYVITWESVVTDEEEVYVVGDCEIISTSETLQGDIVIPSEIYHNDIRYTVNSIDEEAFKNRDNIRSIYIPEHIGIWYRAFENCTGLTEITAGFDISSSSFSGCVNLAKVTLTSSSPWSGYIGEELFESCKNSLEELRLIVVNDNFSGINIGNYAFMDFKKLQYVSLEGVLEIGYSAFNGCENLTHIDFSDSLIYIGECAFFGCKYLNDIVSELPNEIAQYPGTIIFPENLKYIGYAAFAGCEMLESVYLPKSLLTIGNAFSGDSSGSDGRRKSLGCPQLKQINVDINNPNYASIDGVLFDKNITKLICYPQGAERENYVLPETVTSIAASAFRFSNVVSVDIPGEVTVIDSFTFSECYNLISVGLPETLKTIGDWAFNCCHMLKPDIPDGVTKIDEFAFQGLRVSSITLPKSLEYIGSRAFANCKILHSIEIPDGVRTFGEAAFQMCENLKTVFLPASLEPSSSSHNYENVFGGCFNIEDVYYNSDDPIEVDSSLFISSYENAILHVPAVALDKAKTTLPWSLFKDIEPYDFNGINEILDDFKSDASIEIYDLNGIKIADSIDGLASGIYIMHQGKTVKKISVK